MTFETPVLFLVFNRPETTKQVFAKIRAVKPRQLFIASDGPRSDRPKESEIVEQVRKIVLDGIDWDCEVKTLFREKNLGCGKAVSEAITWFFQHVEQGIILEDDCLPDLSFFHFCDQLLNYHRDNHKVMHIGGTNFLYPNFKYTYDYYFSKYPHVWGWATWRRAWEKYDFHISNITEPPIERILNLYPCSTDEAKYWLSIYRNLRDIDTWDYQWIFSIWVHGGYSIVPSINLVSNIGFGIDATHTKSAEDKASKRPTGCVKESLKHPITISLHAKSDQMVFKYFIAVKESLLNKLTNRAMQKIQKLVRQ
jgi:hypothetical protein